MPPYKPYKSGKQRAWAHTAEGIAALGKADVEGKDQASKGLDLPERSNSSNKPAKMLRHTTRPRHS